MRRFRIRKKRLRILWSKTAIGNDRRNTPFGG